MRNSLSITMGCEFGIKEHYLGESPSRTSWSNWGSLRSVSHGPSQTWPRFAYETWRDLSLGWEWFLQRAPWIQGIGQIGVRLMRFKLTYISWNEKVMLHWKISGFFVYGVCILSWTSLMGSMVLQGKGIGLSLSTRACVRISNGYRSFIWYGPVVQLMTVHSIPPSSSILPYLMIPVHGFGELICRKILCLSLGWLISSITTPLDGFTKEICGDLTKKSSFCFCLNLLKCRQTRIFNGVKLHLSFAVFWVFFNHCYYLLKLLFSTGKMTVSPQNHSALCCL